MGALRAYCRTQYETLDGAKHDKFVHPSRPRNVILVPRHATVTLGVTRSIAKVGSKRVRNALRGPSRRQAGGAYGSFFPIARAAPRWAKPSRKH